MSDLLEHKSTMQSAGLLGVASLGGLIAGFFLQLLVAYHFGVSTDTDAFYMAQSISELLSKLLMGGSITAVFLPMFVDKITRGRHEEAWRLGLNLFHIMTALFLLLVILLGFFAGDFIALIAPGYSAQAQLLATSLLRILLPSFLFMFLVDMATSMLHAFKSFKVPAALRLVNPLISIGAILILVSHFGIYALAVGVVMGSVIQLFFVFGGLKRRGLTYNFIFAPMDGEIIKLVFLVYPFVFSVLIALGSGVVYRILASELVEGSFSAIKYAEKITQPLLQMLVASVTTVIYPIMSEKASLGDIKGIRATMGGAIRLLVFTTLPVAIGIFLLRDPIVMFIYQRGNFSADATILTSLALMWLIVGLTTNGISSVLGHATMALQQTRAAVAVTVASQAIAVALFVLLVPRMALAGIALATSLVPLSIAVLYYLYLTRYIPRLYLIFWHPTLLKTGILVLIMGVVVRLARGWSANLVDTSQLSLMFQLAVPISLGAFVFVLGAYLWRVPEIHNVTQIIREKKNKWLSL